MKIIRNNMRENRSIIAVLVRDLDFTAITTLGGVQIIMCTAGAVNVERLAPHNVHQNMSP